jgi:hypothetical protein
MEEVKVYLDEKHSTHVVCKKCGRSKQIELPSARHPRSAVVKCSCGNTFSLIFETRRHYRKRINSFGKCFAAGDKLDGALVNITDISRSGMRFIKMDGRQLQVNERIRVSFPLGNDTIDCAAVVFNLRGDGIGVKFMNLDEHNKKVLGFFLLP